MKDVMGADGFAEASIVVEMCIEAKGARDHVEFFGGSRFGAFKDVFEDTGSLAASAMDKSGGLRVAVNRPAIDDAILLSDADRAAPTDELSFNGIAIRMGANRTAARVASQIGRRRGGRCVEGRFREGSEGCFGAVERETSQLRGSVEFLARRATGGQFALAGGALSFFGGAVGGGCGFDLGFGFGFVGCELVGHRIR